MATNNWKNILTALKSKIRAEMKCSVLSDKSEIKANQFIRLYPIGSDQLEKASFLETRQYNISCQYYLLNNQKPAFEDYVQHQIAMLEEVIGDNIVLTLADSTTAYDVTMGPMTYEIEVEGYDDYHIVEWELSCTHSRSIGAC